MVACPVYTLLTKFIRAVQCGDHLRAVDVVIDMKNFVIRAQFCDLPVRKNLTECRIEVVPLTLPPEVINQQKTPAQQILSEIFCLLRAQDDSAILPDFQHIQEWIIKDLLIIKPQYDRIALHLDVGEPRDAPQEIHVRIRKVD